MADEPSIDEILASLDKLLKESDSGNDDTATSTRPAPASDDDTLETLENSLAEVFGKQTKPPAKKPARPLAETVKPVAKEKVEPAQPGGMEMAGGVKPVKVATQPELQMLKEPAAEVGDVPPADAGEATATEEQPAAVVEPRDADAGDVEAAASEPEPDAGDEGGFEPFEEDAPEEVEPEQPEAMEVAEEAPRAVAAVEPQATEVAAGDEEFVEVVEEAVSVESVGEASQQPADEAAIEEPVEAMDEPAEEAVEEVVAEPDVVEEAAPASPPQKLVLTEAMLIEDNQNELPFGHPGPQRQEALDEKADAGVASAGNIAESVAPSDKPAADLPPEEWIELVGQRVVDRLETLLPRLIREAIDEVGLTPQTQIAKNRKDSNDEPA